MKKVTKMVLMLCLILSGAFCHASSEARTGNVNGDSIWIGTDEMVIDYIKVYQLATDCSTDETITCQNDLDSFDFKLKKSVAITASNGPITVDNTDKVTFRVTDSFEITGPFQVDLGGEFTVIRQDCPTQ